MSEQKVHAALIEARRSVSKVQKGGENTFDRYKYAKFEDFVEACESALDSAGITVVYSVEEYRRLPERPTKKGGSEYAAEVLMSATAIASDGSQVSIRAAGEGQDRADKAYYKAQTGAKKYALAGLLNLVTTDDPEVDDGKDHGRPTVESARPSAADPAAEAVGEAKRAFAQWSGIRDVPDLQAAWRDAGKAANGGKFDEKNPEHVVALVAWINNNAGEVAFIDAMNGGNK